MHIEIIKESYNLYASACGLLLLLCQFSGKQTGKYITCIEINKKGKIEIFVTGNLPRNLAIFTTKYFKNQAKKRIFDNSKVEALVVL